MGKSRNKNLYWGAVILLSCGVEINLLVKNKGVNSFFLRYIEKCVTN